MKVESMTFQQHLYFLSGEIPSLRLILLNDPTLLSLNFFLGSLQVLGGVGRILRSWSFWGSRTHITTVPRIQRPAPIFTRIQLCPVSMCVCPKLMEMERNEPMAPCSFQEEVDTTQKHGPLMLSLNGIYQFIIMIKSSDIRDNQT